MRPAAIPASCCLALRRTPRQSSIASVWTSQAIQGSRNAPIAELSVQTLRVVRPDGSVGILLSAGSDGTVQYFFDKSDSPRVGIVCDEGSAMLSLNDAHKIERVWMSAKNDSAFVRMRRGDDALGYEAAVVDEGDAAGSAVKLRHESRVVCGMQVDAHGKLALTGLAEPVRAAASK